MNRPAIARIGAALLFGIGSLVAEANSISGSVLNNSTWTNATPPWPVVKAVGNGSGNGALRAGAWTGNTVGPAVATTNITGLVSLVSIGPGPFPYSMGGSLTDATYNVIAWIDGNNNNTYDTGEPRSAVQSVSATVSNPAVGINLEVVDDLDGDGLPDWWEVQYLGSADPASEADSDRDGILNRVEYAIGTNPGRFDTDGDSMDDGWEYSYEQLGAPIRPWVADGTLDADGDGLLNIQEYRGIDGQGILSQDPNEAAGVARANPYNTGDQLHPVNVDTDNDGLVDSFEAAWYDPAGGIDPKQAGDPAADPDNDGLTNYREQCLLKAFQQGGATDIWSDGPESIPPLQPDGTRIFTPAVSLGASSGTIRSDLSTFRTNALNTWTDPTPLNGYTLLADHGHDTDDDRLPDGWEIEFGLDPKSRTGINGYYGDPDNDGLINYQEYKGQDGVEGTGDETNPNVHNWRPLTTGGGTGLRRPVVSLDYWTLTRASPENGTVGGALPTASRGFDSGRDTDDDGVPDHTEIRQEYPPGSGMLGASPVHSMAPFLRKSALIISPSGISIPDPESDTRGFNPQLHEDHWTLECYVKLLGTNLSGRLIRYAGFDYPGYENRNTYLLGISNNVPYASFDTIGLSDYTYTVWGLTLPTNRWVHMAAAWNPSQNTLTLYIDGIFAQSQRIYEEGLAAYYFASDYAPELGSSADGSFVNNLLMDEVRIWGIARTADQIEQYRTQLVPQTDTGLRAYYRFDDGGASAEDFSRKAQNSLLAVASTDYTFGDRGYALATGSVFRFETDAAPVLGVMPLGADDEDGDRLPDDWEMINHLNSKSTLEPFGANDDADGDFLSNLYEFLAETNPWEFDTNQDGLPDFNEDLDGDGLVNLVEQDYGSRPDMVDTDDDGLTDLEEQDRGTDPANPLDPIAPRSLKFAGSPKDYLDIPIAAAQRLLGWTIEAWVNPETDTGNNGTILRRTVQQLSGGRYAMNYVMGVTNGTGLRPYAGFVTTSGTTYFVTGPALATGAWTHIAATFTNNALRLYINGALSASNTIKFAKGDVIPTNGKGGDTFVRIGEDFQGRIDEVRLWKRARTGAEVLLRFNKSVVASEMANMVHHFPFDDGYANTNALPFGPHHRAQDLQDFLYPKDWEDQWRHAARRHGQVEAVDDGAFVPSPTLRVNILPPGAVNDGARFSYDGSGWLESGTLLQGVEAGSHTIQFLSVPGWVAPSPVTVSLTNGINTILPATYTPIAGAMVWGSVINRSVWTNTVFPGDGTGQGALLVGVWDSTASWWYSFMSPGPIFVLTPYTFAPYGSTPPFGDNLTGRVALPVDMGPFAYAIMGLNQTEYAAMAWMDWNGNYQYDLGEPRSPLYHVGALSQSNLVVRADLEVTDDLDKDGLRDAWEYRWFGNLTTVSSATGDSDNDGLSNGGEMAADTNPLNWDTDGDGMDDGWEFNKSLNPATSDALADADGDGLPNLLEYRGVDGHGILATDPGQSGGGAQVARINPNDSGDALNPLNTDSDGDGLLDSFECAWYDPANGITPTVAGDPATDPDQDGLSNFREQCLHTNLAEGADMDIWSRVAEYTTTAAGLSSRITITNIPAIFVPGLALGVTAPTIAASLSDLRNHGWTDPTKGTGFSPAMDLSQPGNDTDGDLLPDGWEVEFGLNPRDWTGDNGYWGDPDLDGLINYQEYRGQDGNPGSGDETNPNEHYWRTLSTERGTSTGRPRLPFDYWTQLRQGVPGTLGSAAPSLPLGADPGNDTDDDGYPDSEEIQQEYYLSRVGTSPVHSMSPLTRRAALVTAVAGVPVPDPEGGVYYLGYRPDFHARNWAIECYVKLLGDNLSGSLIRCGTGYGMPTAYTNRICFELGLSNSVPFVAFDTIGITNPTYRIQGLALATNRWIHMAASWDQSRNTLGLYVDGIFAMERRFYEEAMSGHLFDLFEPPVLGASTNGSFVNRLLIDEVRVWGRARGISEIEADRTRLIAPTSTGLLAYFRFDDGGVSAEDFTRRAQSGLLNPEQPEYLFGDFGYALTTNGFVFTNDAAPVYGVSTKGADDSDGDGLPDDWELINHLDPLSAESPNGAGDDPDGDGLSNLTEFFAETNPHARDTDGDAVPDVNEDYDEDGLVNLMEQTLGSRPDIADTDDDGMTDKEEQAAGTNPANALDPAVSRALAFGGSMLDYLQVPVSASQQLSSWTIEAWINPSNAVGNSGTILRRSVQSIGSGSFALNYVLGVTYTTNLMPYAGFVMPSGITNFVYGPAVATGKWTHLAAAFDAGTGALAFYTNGVLVASRSAIADAPPTGGRGGDSFLRIGEDFNGQIDEVRLWGTTRTVTQILDLHDETLGAGDMTGLVHYWPLDDSQANTYAMPFGAFHQPQGYQDFIYPRDWEQQWQHAARPVGGVAETMPGAFIPPPSLRVLLVPPSAVADGAVWSFDGGDWLLTGTLLTGLEPGSHTLQYKALTGWSVKPPETIVLTNGYAVTLTRTYEPTATLRINLLPPDAIADGAMWRVDGGSWQSTGTIVSNLDAGIHSVEYATIAGWNSPANETATLGAGEAQVLTRTYTRPSITVFIVPNAAVAGTNGARWSIDGGAWTNSGVTIQVPAGIHTISYRALSGWLTPSNAVVNLTNASSTVVTGLYHSLTIYGGSGSATGLFRRPFGVVLGATRELYVTDSDNHRVQKRDPASGTWSVFGAGVASANTPSGAQTWFKQPSGICMDRDGNLYVADQGNHRIQKRNATNGTWSIIGGNVNGTFGSAIGQFNTPMDVAVDSATNLYVADRVNNRIQRLSNSVWSVFVSAGIADGYVQYPRGLTIGSSDSVIVSDDGTSSGQHRVQRFRSDGAFLERLGSGQAGQGGLRRPSGLSYSPVDALFLADADNDRVLWSTTPNVWEPIMVTNGMFRVPNDVIWDPRGRVVVADTEHNQIVEIGITDADVPENPILYGLTLGPTNTIQWFGLEGWLYGVQYTDNMFTWSLVPGMSNMLGTNAMMTGYDASPAPIRFYRVVFY